MKLFSISFLFASFGHSYSQVIFPVTTPVSFTLEPIATGASVVTMVPFDLDYTSLSGYESNTSVLYAALNSKWTSEVVVFDDSENFDSFLSLSRGRTEKAPVQHLWGETTLGVPASSLFLHSSANLAYLKVEMGHALTWYRPSVYSAFCRPF